MELAVGPLGPLDIRQDGEPVAAPVGNRCRILVLMLLDGGAVSRSRMAAELWGPEAPRSAPANLRSYLSGLRAWLADRADLIRDGSGWQLVPPSRVRLTVDVEEYADVLVKRGEYEAAQAMLHEFLGDHPHRERAWGQLMVACYRSGDLAGALDAYRRARVALITGYGIEPGAELATLHRAILQRKLPVEVTGYPPEALPHRHLLRPPARIVRRPEAAGFAERG
ncbi:AfsR/SARP family transcriptional regulator [Plantactinospora sp. DSM 117369]